MSSLINLALMLGLLAAPSAAPLSSGPAGAKLVVVATVFPLAEFARDVAGDAAVVSLLLPPGADVHTWQPRVGDVRALASADLLISVGGGLEPWLPGLVRGAAKPGLRRLEASAGLAVLPAHQHEAGESEPADHAEEAFDPHVWLDFGLDEAIVDSLAKALTDLAPGEAPGFGRRAEALKERLRALDAAFREGLRACAGREFILGGHAAFAYLARRYGLIQTSLYGPSPDAAPTPKTTAAIVARARRTKARTIFYEPNVGDKMARLVAAEIGADIRLLHPGHNISPAQKAAGISFFRLMEDNLEALRHGLACR
ncbi:MAG: zinc ABC transporter substrate-binding protein [Candidatus Aminicenantes bacterium]|nr:zinc ABC transporter substrate-binding protein [Candidatus Aminicenantes bacterium]